MITENVPRRTLLQFALEGIEHRKAAIEQELSKLGQTVRVAEEVVHQPAVRSAATRKRIAAAQKKRWAERRRQKGESNGQAS